MEKKNCRYIKMYFSDFENDLFQGEPFSKLHAWADLLFIANEKSNVIVRGSIVCSSNGEIQISMRDLCKRWGWGNTRMNSFMAVLEKEGKIIIKKSKFFTSIKVSNYYTYIPAKSPYKSQNASPTKSPSDISDITDNVDVTEDFKENFKIAKSFAKSLTKSHCKSLEKTQTATKSPTKSPSDISDITDNVDVTEEKSDKKNENASPSKSPSAKNEILKEKETKNKRKKSSPTPPIKEIKKEKKEKETPATPNVVAPSPNVDGYLTHTCVGVRSAKGEKLILTSEKPKEEKQEKEYTLTWRARVAFSDFYRERYGEEKYWKISEMTALKQLLKQIKFSRSHKDNPLPVDDDSVLSAFTEFLKRICTPWILQNFLVTNLNSKYDSIIQDIKNNKNGTSNTTSINTGCYMQQCGQDIIERQKKDCINELRELEEKLATGQIKSSRWKGEKSEIELPDF